MHVARITSKSRRLSSTFCFLVQSFTCDADRGACTLELSLPRTHFVARGGIPQRIPPFSTSLLFADSSEKGAALERTFASDTLDCRQRRHSPNALHIRHCTTSLLLATAVKRVRRRNVSALQMTSSEAKLS